MNTSRDKSDFSKQKPNIKTYSMNDSLLNRILKDKLKREITKNQQFQDSLTSKASNEKNLNISSRNIQDCLNNNLSRICN